MVNMVWSCGMRWREECGRRRRGEVEVDGMQSKCENTTQVWGQTAYHSALHALPLKETVWHTPFLPPWCLPGASPAVQLVPKKSSCYAIHFHQAASSPRIVRCIGGRVGGQGTGDRRKPTMPTHFQPYQPSYCTLNI